MYKYSNRVSETQAGRNCPVKYTNRVSETQAGRNCPVKYANRVSETQAGRNCPVKYSNRHRQEGTVLLHVVISHCSYYTFCIS